MYNQFIIKHASKKFRKIADEEKRNETWLKRYKTQIRPNLITKHQRRIQGFAKKMQCEPVILPEENQEPELKAHVHEKQKNVTKQKYFHSNTGFKDIYSARMKSQNKVSRILLKQVSAKYIDPIKSFRDRSKQKQINPPMKYGNRNSKLVQKFISIQKNLKKQRDESNLPEIRTRNFSRNSLHSSYQNENYSDFDVMSINNDNLLKMHQNYKTEKQIKEQQELKALSHDRLYFKSLVNFQQKIKDTTIKKNIKDILVKCKVVKPVTEKKRKQIIERDQFAEMMKMYTSP